eukprot:3280591-Pyramimonas_sp.AAC.2
MASGPWMHQLNQAFTRERVRKEEHMLNMSFLNSVKADELAMKMVRQSTSRQFTRLDGSSTET